MNELDIWDPFRKLKRREKGLGFFDEDFFAPIKMRLPHELIRAPLIDIKDAGPKLKISAELPGIDKKELNIDVSERQLTLSAKAKAEREEKEKGYFFKERKYQSFYRSIPLPAEVIPEKAKAELRNGILELDLPKKFPARKAGKTVKVKVE